MIGSQKPLELLSKSLEQQVEIKLKGNRELRGKLVGFDNHMNLILENAEEIMNSDETTLKKLGTIIVRGDNVIIISPPKMKV